jgi:hypothetical protein
MVIRLRELGGLRRAAYINLMPRAIDFDRDKR